MTAPTLPMTPEDGWTLDNLPDNLPKHTELIRGVLVMSPQKTWHMAIIRMFDRQLYDQVPDEYALLFEMAVRRSNRSAPEPDLSIVRAGAVEADKSIYSPADVLVAAEIISPESEERDREDKPIMYAAMGIPTFWLVERGADLAPIVHEHQLYGGAYRLMRTHIGHLQTEIPFSMEVRLEAPKL
ncbi:Uma2 family endonuclease [Actinocrinis puniceicyclus]|uniref:Uma2 family endonuclease n=1 Tax=Actinocrinis puniceicyclus TaxID=977794 RepID=A0A8J8BA81_9ACTN|nr:Uma2 family endonuclease [Actinocrinis puniceicyclus]MBS2961808.1 Uma2 family endonuclease [Actinocrinis puniceicyclus]